MEASSDFACRRGSCSPRSLQCSSDDDATSASESESSEALEEATAEDTAPAADPVAGDEQTAATTAPETEPEQPTPEPGSADVDIDSFEQFPLPDYAAAALGDGYSSYLIEVEPGVDVHVLDSG